MQLVCVCMTNVFLIVVSSNVASMTVPRSSVVVIGERVEMKCNANGSDLTTWTYTAWNTSTVTNLYLGEDIVTSMRSRYKIDKRISEQHNLIIDSVDLAHAGRYRCSAAIQKTLWNDIQLTVLGRAKDAGVTQGSGAVSVSYPVEGPGGTPGFTNLPITALAIGGPLLFLLIIVIILSCVVHRKRLKDASSARPDVALNTDLTSYDNIVLSCERSPNHILKGDRLPGRSDGRVFPDNVVYAEVCKTKGQSKGSKGGNIGVKSRPLQTPTRERQIVTGVDGTVYAELSGVKPPARKGEVFKVPKLPAFSQVEIYAAIDHSGKVPAPPLLQK